MAEDHRDRASTQSGRRLGPYAIITCFTALLALLGVYALFLAPLQKKVLGHEAHALAQELDAGVQTRSAALDVALRDMGIEGLLQPKALDNVMKTVRGRFPDILSMDVIADDGTILIMIGEVPMAEAGLFRIADTTRFVRADAAAFTWGWAFSDDAPGNCFHMTRMASSQDGRNWFVRARFSREWVGETMVRFVDSSGLKAALIPVTIGSKGAAADRTGAEWGGPAGRASVPVAQVAVSGSWWWTGPTAAEARLRSPGWLVRVERNYLFPTGLLLACSVVLLGLVATGLQLRARAASATTEPPTSIVGGVPVPASLQTKATPCEQPPPGEVPRTSGDRERAEQNTADEIQHQAVFSRPMLPKPQRIDPVRCANPNLGKPDKLDKPDSGEDDRFESGAVQWFEPEPEEESAGSVTSDQVTARPEEGIIPEYLDVEWTEHPQERPRTKETPAEARALVVPGT
jgi:hypothetical protein